MICRTCKTHLEDIYHPEEETYFSVCNPCKKFYSNLVNIRNPELKIPVLKDEKFSLHTE